MRIQKCLHLSKVKSQVKGCFFTTEGFKKSSHKSFPVSLLLENSNSSGFVSPGNFVIT